MRKNCIFLFLVMMIAVYGVKVENHHLQLEASHQMEQQSHDTNKLPQYINRGYDIFLGNPLDQLQENGYRNVIFATTYNRNYITEDFKFKYPDDVTHMSQTTCSSSITTTKITGTKSYQSSLDQTVSVSGGYSGLFSAAFSLSVDYKQAEKSNVQKKQVTMQSTSKCRYYKLFTSDKYTSKLYPEFVNNVISATRSGNWIDFIRRYGTHYFTEIQYGGRYTRKLSLSEESVAKMESKSINIYASAQAEYAGFSGSFSSNTTTGSTVSSQFNKSVENRSSSFVGGISSTDQIEWKNSVKDNPMPVSFSLRQISNLFSQISGIDSGAAANSYNQAIKQYSKGGKQPVDVAGLEYKAKVAATEEFGGHGGDLYEYMTTNILWADVVGINMRCGGYADKLVLKFYDGKTYDYSNPMGGNGGHEYNFTLQDNDKISSILVWAGDWIDGFQVQTKNGKTSDMCGNQNSHLNRIDIPSDQRIIGIHGRKGGFIDRIGFYLGKAVLAQKSSFDPKITKEGTAGGTGGSQFEFLTSNPGVNQARKVSIRSGSMVDSLQFFFGISTSPQFETGPHIGGFGGGEHTFQVPFGQYLSKIKVKYGSRIDSIQFFTSGGISKKYGGDGGEHTKEWNVQGTDKRFSGVYGASGSQIDRIGFITALHNNNP